MWRWFPYPRRNGFCEMLPVVRREDTLPRPSPEIGVCEPMSKGTRRERQAVEIFQEAGFAPYRPATVRFGENDLWGLFDVLAVSPSYGSVKAVQVKSNRAVGVRSWRRHTWLWRRLGFDTEYWVPVDGEGWRVIGVRDGGHETLVDERESDCNMGNAVIEWLKGV